MNRRGFLRSFAAGAACASVLPLRAASRAPNVILILCDDLGYGDLGVYGSSIPTPNLDAMAAGGVRFRQFYAPASVCSPSRAGLLTGRYAARVGIPGVLGPNSDYGLPDGETTLAQSLRSSGYRTLCAGKWHLGSRQRHAPTNHGFDEFFGVPYSNDMEPLPLLRNQNTLEQKADNNLLTQRYTQQAQSWIRSSVDQPFFLYLAHNMPHIPLGASPDFAGKTGLGPYADAVAEVDWSVGQILATLQETGLDDNTLVMFTSDNGPWYQGSPGNLRGRKGDTYEGGMRVPFLARMPGRIPTGLVSDAVGSLIDVFPTVSRLAGASLPGVQLDGVNLWDTFTGSASSVDRDVLLYFDHWNIQCARLGRWKLHFSRYNSPPWIDAPACGRLNLPLVRPELYNIDRDPSEAYECGTSFPEIVAEIQARVEALLPGMPDAVRDSWRTTRESQIQWSPTGANPVPKPNPVPGAPIPGAEVPAAVPSPQPAGSGRITNSSKSLLL